jgi:ribosome recycling factor
MEMTSEERREQAKYGLRTAKKAKKALEAVNREWIRYLWVVAKDPEGKEDENIMNIVTGLASGHDALRGLMDLAEELGK